MKVSILLPFKENFSPSYAGAVSLFVNDTIKISKYKNTTCIFGNTKFKNTFNLNYKNILPSTSILQSQNKQYVNEFIKIEKNRKSNLIELHNRPIYLNYLVNSLSNRTYILYFHNDPLSMSGSKTILERIFLMKNCFKIIFNSSWSKKRFLEEMKSDYVNSEKLVIINQSARKDNDFKIKNKKKIITFVGKLNRSKGYDLFGSAIIKILNKYKNWTSIVVGDEPRDKIDFNNFSMLSKT